MALGGQNPLREYGSVREGLVRATSKAERYLDVDWTADAAAKGGKAFQYEGAIDFTTEPVRGMEVSVASHEDVWKLWDQSVRMLDQASTQRVNSRSPQLTVGSKLSI